MKYYSTNDQSIQADLKEAVFKGLARDGGLYMPERIPVMGKDFLESIEKMNLQEISYEISKALFGEDVPSNRLKEIVFDAINFHTPVIEITENIKSLELFHGPTLAFKDVGARFMARLLSWLVKDYDKEIHVLVATSGDTGSAVANGFLDVEGIKVHVLYPSGKVSDIQEMQFTTLGKNITALEINGSFDDCQKLVKTAFSDPNVNTHLTLTSANSINLARLLPQSFYYWDAWRQSGMNEELVICVPSGNFGNLTAGLIAKKMGMKVKHFITATNANDIVPEYLETARYNPRPSIQTLANAMDVGNPSNFARMLDIFDHSHKKMASEISAYSYSDDEIRSAIRLCRKETGYLLDPHGATGYMASRAYLKENPGSQITFLETAHPVKFRDTVEKETGEKIEIPERLKIFMNKEKVATRMSSDYFEFKDYLLGLNT